MKHLVKSVHQIDFRDKVIPANKVFDAGDAGTQRQLFTMKAVKEPTAKEVEEYNESEKAEGGEEAEAVRTVHQPAHTGPKVQNVVIDQTKQPPEVSTKA